MLNLDSKTRRQPENLEMAFRFSFLRVSANGDIAPKPRCTVEGPFCLPGE